jgi:hypothetical protein
MRRCASLSPGWRGTPRARPDDSGGRRQSWDGDPVRQRSASDMQSAADLWSTVRAQWTGRQLPLAMKGWPG